jgi:hypothetical protein
MNNSRDFIDSIENGENLEAESHFSGALSDKVGASLENRRQELANELVNEERNKITGLVKGPRMSGHNKSGAELDAGSGRNERDKVADQARRDRLDNRRAVTGREGGSAVGRTAGQPKDSDELDSGASAPKKKKSGGPVNPEAIKQGYRPSIKNPTMTQQLQRGMEDRLAKDDVKRLGKGAKDPKKTAKIAKKMKSGYQGTEGESGRTID